ncbi:hypothetical protein LEMLEM_LOCUS11386, partial [Lemmus lemmus]
QWLSTARSGGKSEKRYIESIAGVKETLCSFHRRKTPAASQNLTDMCL